MREPGSPWSSVSPLLLQPIASASALRPGDLNAIDDDGRDWLRVQLKDAAPQLADPQLRSSSDILAQALELRRKILASRRAAASVDDTVAPRLRPR